MPARDPWPSMRAARGGGPWWQSAKTWALLPLLLLVGLYSAFGLVFLVIPARLTTALLRGPRRVFRRLSRWVGWPGPVAVPPVRSLHTQSAPRR